MNKKESQDKKQIGTQPECRKYIRLNVIFPVEFQFLDTETGESISDVKQGFTRNVSKGGICLEVNNIEEGFEVALREKRARLDLRLHIPLHSRETKAIAEIAWYKKIRSGYPNRYNIGLSFSQIDRRDRNRIYFYARQVSLLPKIVSIFVLLLILGVSCFYTSNIKLRTENQQLVKKLIAISSKKSNLERNILKYDVQRRGIESQIKENQTLLRQYEEKVRDLSHLATELKNKSRLLEYFEISGLETKEKLKNTLLEKHRLSKKVLNLSEETRFLKQRISILSTNKVKAIDTLQQIISTYKPVEEKEIESMYKWIKNHQNSLTGLVVSYEGDKSLEDWAFTYDESLACQCFILFGDRENARDILEFYRQKAEKKDGGYVNAYDAYTGLVLEYDVHAGPNIWLGIAMLHYTERFNDRKYLSVAKEIADWLISLQREDKEFGIRGGPNFSWFSTEHNLDAYAFFGMLYKLTGEDKYLIAQERSFNWIKKHAFDIHKGRINRGKGDATIATDTFAWAIAAIGPQKLKENDMDPDQIMDFAETNCQVSVYYRRPDNRTVEVTGFDFGKYRHLPRRGIVSSEWTAQMAVALRIMSIYHKKLGNSRRADFYSKKAEFYLSELDKMIIISPSRTGQGACCLPYATDDNVETGHGWRVAKGSRTGSTSGTAYTIFAKRNYNPLALE